MTSSELIPEAVLKRKAVVYVRQSTQCDTGMPGGRGGRPCLILRRGKRAKGSRLINLFWRRCQVRIGPGCAGSRAITRLNGRDGHGARPGQGYLPKGDGNMLSMRVVQQGESPGFRAGASLTGHAAGIRHLTLEKFPQIGDSHAGKNGRCGYFNEHSRVFLPTVAFIGCPNHQAAGKNAERCTVHHGRNRIPSQAPCHW
jgi:hypothetical protein